MPQSRRAFPGSWQLLSAGLALAAVVVVQPAAAKSLPPTWAHERSDVPADPAVTFGKLANGLRYAIMRSSTPAGALSLRLRLDAGSLHEADDERGVAHILEHMAFRGSKNFADGEVVRTMERLGLEFGRDSNAATSPTDTVYEFDMPASDAASIDTALKLLRDVGDGLDLTDAALATERNVVMSELRLADSPSRRAQQSVDEIVQAGLRLPKRLPIGTADSIRTVPASTLRRFYEAYYRPERAVLVAVGDVDPAMVIKQIEANFRSWQGRGKPRSDVSFGTLEPRKLQVMNYAEAGLTDMISARWVRPAKGGAQSEAKDRLQMLTELGTRAISARLQRGAQAQGAAFSQAAVANAENISRTVDITALYVIPTPGRWRDAARQARQIVTAALDQGLSQREVDRVSADLIADFRNGAEGAATRETRRLANEIAQTVDDDQVHEQPAALADRIAKMLPAMDAAAVTKRMRELMAPPPVVFMTTPEPVAGAGTALHALFSGKVPKAAGDPDIGAPDAVVWPYTSFGPAGAIAERSAHKELDATFVRFANNVHLAVKRTAFKRDGVSVSVNIGGGRLALKPGAPPADELLGAYSGGGLRQIDLAGMQQALAGKSWGLRARLLNSVLSLTGSTTSKDLETELQVLAAYITEPAFRAVAFEQSRQNATDDITMAESDAISTLGRNIEARLHPGDTRWAVLTAEQAKAAQLADLTAWLEPMLAQGSLDITIVGDVDVEAAIALAAKTFGALPQRPALLPRAGKERLAALPPTPQPVVERFSGTGKAALLAAWPGPERPNQAAWSDSSIMMAIFNARLTEAVRSRLGAGYSPYVDTRGSYALPGWGAMFAMADTAPGQTEAVLAAIRDIASDLRQKPVGTDELARAVEPAAAKLINWQQDNDYIAGSLFPPAIDPAISQSLFTEVAALKAVTPERIQAAAQKYLRDDAMHQVIMLPR